jgi:hypothetical protein
MVSAGLSSYLEAQERSPPKLVLIVAGRIQFSWLQDQDFHFLDGCQLEGSAFSY